MTMTLRDVKHGMCWRFTAPDAEDHRPSYSTTPDERRLERLHFPKPCHWDEHHLDDHDEFNNKHANQPIQLLQHYSVAPEGKPIEDFEAVPASKVRTGQWYLGGTWKEVAAKTVASSLNRLEVKTHTYASSCGPSNCPGWAVVRTMPVKSTAASEPVVRSCIDPLDKALDALTALRIEMCGGVNGIECMWRYEYAQAHEQLARTATGFVSTNSEYPMDEAQVALARKVWSAELRFSLLESQAKATVERRKSMLACDDVDELPNMTFVDG